MLIIFEAVLLYTPVIFIIMTIAFIVLSMRDSMRDSDDSDKQKKKKI